MANRALLLGLTLVAGCYGGGAFNCTTDTQCSGGVCEPDGFCAFADPSCPTGFKYGDLSGPKSNTCVGGQLMPDAPIDMPNPDTPPGQICYGAGIVQPCFSTAPTGNQTFSVDTTIDTDNSSLCANGLNTSPWCVVAAATITVDSGVTVKGQGTRPLVFLATGAIQNMGTIDVSTQKGAPLGAAADVAGCNAGTPPTSSAGAAGGSFGGHGGTGGITGGGTSGNPLTISALRGGCAGQNGINAAMTSTTAGGRGGGAVYLLSATSISNSGTINASGEGGAGGATTLSAAGGGGGSGGYIGLEAPSISNSGNIVANGGGGGEGSGAQSTGTPGGDPNAATPTTAALGGGNTSAYGTDGGNGAAGVMLDGAAGSNLCSSPCVNTPQSGGGGGGGAGIIKVAPATTLGGQVSPPVS